jgi:outer membrane usher protein FimD/PapC
VFASAPVSGGGSHYGEVALSGAVVGVDGYWGVTRRVADSFVLARLGVPQAGVEVSVNNQVQGRTDAQGQLFIPQVGAFGRQDITINDKQLALEYNVRETRRTIAPAFRSGTVVNFGAHKMHAVAGTAWQLRAGQRLPIATRAWEMRGPKGSVQVEAAGSGDFYLEDVAPGSYRGELQLDDRKYSCRMTVPEFEEVVLDLKEGIVCE